MRRVRSTACASRHVPLYFSEPSTSTISPRRIDKLGALLGTSNDRRAMHRTRSRRDIASLRARYARAAARSSVFYQVWDDPLMTLKRDMSSTK